MEKTDVEKLEILLHHWVEHNQEHGQEFRKWAERAEKLGLGTVADEILAAVGQLDQANKHLETALEELKRGGR